MEWAPIGSAVVVSFAMPEPFRVGLPSLVVSSKKVNVPAGFPAREAGVTFAVNVTESPLSTLVADEASVVIVTLRGEVPPRKKALIT